MKRIMLMLIVLFAPLSYAKGGGGGHGGGAHSVGHFSSGMAHATASSHPFIHGSSNHQCKDNLNCEQKNIGTQLTKQQSIAITATLITFTAIGIVCLAWTGD